MIISSVIVRYTVSVLRMNGNFWHMPGEQHSLSVSVSVNLCHFLLCHVSILLSVSLPPFSCPPCVEYLCPCAVILLRLWHYISHVLTHLLATSCECILLSVSLPPFSCPACVEYLCPCAVILLRLWHYISHVLTYLSV